MGAQGVIFHLGAFFYRCTMEFGEMYFKFSHYLVHQAMPVTRFWLTEQAHVGIPWCIKSLEHPAPVGRGWQQVPNRKTKTGSEVTDRGIDRDNQIKIFHHRSGIHKATMGSIKFSIKDDKLHRGWLCFELISTGDALQAVDAYAGNMGEWLKEFYGR